jgi:hypothetical protein
MTAVLERLEAARAISAPTATIVGGTFADLDAMLGVMRALRSSGSTEDILGFAIPLEGDPTTPEGLAALANRPVRQRFDLIRAIRTILDPHEPPPDLASVRRGQNSILATPFLGSLTKWLVGVSTFRIPGDAPGDEGTWVLGRPNHAAAVAGLYGAAQGDRAGALASIGLPLDVHREFGERLECGESVLTTCETDEGRARRDEAWMRKRGAAAVFRRLVVSPSQVTP